MTRPIEAQSFHWNPLFDLEDASNWRGLARRIGHQLLEPYPIPDSLTEEEAMRRAGEPSLARGLAGLAVAYDYLADEFADEPDGKVFLGRAEECLTRAVGSVDGSSTIDLFDGITGVAWVDVLISRRRDSGVDISRFEDVTRHVASYVSGRAWAGPYDLVSGLVGIGVYSLSVAASGSGRQLCEACVDHLIALAEHTDSGATWRTPPQFVPEWQANGAAIYNLGLAHGVPGVIALLALAQRHGISNASSERTLESAVRWLLLQRQPDIAASAFAWQAGAQSQITRTAWCYGDAGVAIALLVAGKAVDRADWVDCAGQLALAAAHRLPNMRGIVDAGVCHGAAGLAHIFNRFFQVTGNPTFAEAARTTLRELTVLSTIGRGIEGLASFRGGVGGQPGVYYYDPSFLTGAAGVALTILAALGAKEPLWDRALLMSG